MTERMSYALGVPGALLTYDVRPNKSSTEPALLLIGSPMGAGGFGTLAGYFTDRTVVTYDPRGVEQSKRSGGATESMPDMHADDLHRLISALNAGPVDIFVSSGGAVNALALVARHPEQVHTLVADEPPAAQTLPGRAAALAANADIHETYLWRGFGPAMAKFLVLVGHKGPLPADYADRPAPDPAMFGLPTEDDGSRDDPLLGQNIVSCTHYKLDFDALRKAPARVVIAAGAESDGELAHRGRLLSQVGSVQSRSSSRVATAASSRTSMAGRVRPRPSPRCYVRCSPQRCDAGLLLGVPSGAMDRFEDSSLTSSTPRTTVTEQRRDEEATSISALLRGVPVFASLADEHIEQVSVQMVKREVVKGELVTVEGQPAEGLYVVASGHFKRFKISPSGHEQILKFLQPGESFGEVPLLDGGPDPASTQAMERSAVYILPRPRFEALVQQSPDLARGLIQFLAARLRHFTELVEDLSFRHRTERVAKLVLERSAMGDLNRLTQSDMAAATGTAREVVGRALHELDQRGAISVERGDITICDQHLLEKIAGVDIE